MKKSTINNHHNHENLYVWNIHFIFYTLCIIYLMFVKMFIIIKLFVTIDQHQWPAVTSCQLSCGLCWEEKAKTGWCVCVVFLTGRHRLEYRYGWLKGTVSFRCEIGQEHNILRDTGHRERSGPGQGGETSHHHYGGIVHSLHHSE